MTKATLTFPGIIFHEFGHKVFCDLTKVKVFKVCYFRFGNPCGYVIHDKPKTFLQSFFISVGPLLTGTIFSLLFFVISKFAAPQNWQQYLFIWIGISISMNSFPSSTDAKSLLKETNRHLKTNLWALFGYPVVLLILIADELSIIWFDILYAIFLCYLVYSVL